MPRTPGQHAYESYQNNALRVPYIPWELISERDQALWEAAAQATQRMWRDAEEVIKGAKNGSTHTETDDSRQQEA